MALPFAVPLEDRDLEGRQKAVRMSVQLAAALCRNTEPGEWHWWRITDGVPSDAVLIRANIDPERDELYLVFAHESFPVCENGQRFDEARPLFRTYRGDGEPPEPRS